MLALLAAGHVPQAREQAQPTLRYANPMRNGLTGKPLSCPDPSVINAHRDYNQATRAIPSVTLAPGTMVLRVAFSASEPWECDPANQICTVEGPQPFYHDGQIYVLYSAASTWDSSYAVGVASSPSVLDPDHVSG